MFFDSPESRRVLDESLFDRLGLSADRGGHGDIRHDSGAAATPPQLERSSGAANRNDCNSGGRGGNNDLSLATAASAAAAADQQRVIDLLRSDNRNLRLRLILLDELLAKRGIDVNLAQELSVASANSEALRQELGAATEALRRRAAAFERAQAELAALRSKEAQWLRDVEELAELRARATSFREMAARIDAAERGAAEAVEAVERERRAGAVREEGLRREVELSAEEARRAVARREADHAAALGEAQSAAAREVAALDVQRHELHQLLQEARTRAAALEREAGHHKDDLERAQQECRRVRSALGEREEELVRARSRADALESEARDSRAAHRAEVAELEQRMADEARRSAEAARMAQQTEHVLLVAKDAFSTLVDVAKAAAAGHDIFLPPLVDHHHHHHHHQQQQHQQQQQQQQQQIGLNELTPSSPGDRMRQQKLGLNASAHSPRCGAEVSSPLREQSGAAAAAAAAAATRAVLGSAIADCVEYIGSERRRSAVQVKAAVRASFDATTAAAEDAHAAVLARCRQQARRLDAANDLLTRTKRQVGRQKSLEEQNTRTLADRAQQLAARCDGLEKFAQQASSENAMLRSDVQLAVTHATELEHALSVFHKQRAVQGAEEHANRIGAAIDGAATKLENSLTACAADVRQLFVQTNVLTPQFVASMTSTINRIDDKLGSVAAAGASGDLLTHVRTQLTSFNRLLQNNYDLGQEVAMRVQQSLVDWEGRMARQLSRFHDVARALQAPVAAGAATASTAVSPANADRPSAVAAAAPAAGRTFYSFSTTHHEPLNASPMSQTRPQPPSSAAALPSTPLHRAAAPASGDGLGGGGGMRGASSPQPQPINGAMPQRQGILADLSGPFFVVPQSPDTSAAAGPGVPVPVPRPFYPSLHESLQQIQQQQQQIQQQRAQADGMPPPPPPSDLGGGRGMIPMAGAMPESVMPEPCGGSQV